MNNIISLSNICYSAPGIREKEILNKISISIKEHSMTGIIGESGSGKTTLAKVISGILKPDSGTIENGKGMNIQLLFQNSEELINPYRKVNSILEDISEEKDDIEKACTILNIGTELLSRKGKTLSGGERQRVGLARILISKPDLIILDEPFSAQDPESINTFTRLFKKINSELGTTFLIISHSIEPLKNLADYIFVMNNGRIIESASTETLFTSPLHPYTKYLLDKGITNPAGTAPENTASSPCSFYRLCGNKIDSCKDGITEITYDDRYVLCNNNVTYKGINESGRES